MHNSIMHFLQLFIGFDCRMKNTQTECASIEDFLVLHSCETNI